MKTKPIVGEVSKAEAFAPWIFCSRRLWLLLGSLALLAMAGLLGVDRFVAAWVRAQEPDGLRQLAMAVSWVGARGIYPITAALLLVWFWRFRPDRKGWRACLWVLTAEAAAAVLVRVLKVVFGRYRPDQALAGQFEYFQLRSKGHSFPSGHTADAAAVATVLWFVYPRLRPVYVGWVVVMALARIGAAQHFVADAMIGAALGILCALLVGQRIAQNCCSNTVPELA